MSARNKPFVLGITGGVGCGKTTAATYLGSLGAAVVDADAISHALTAPEGAALPPIREQFGDGVFCEDGTLDRGALADRAFGDEAARLMLEAIMHPAIQREMLRQMDEAAEAGAQVVVLDVPLLYETGLDALCDEVWVMTLQREAQVLRTVVRDRITTAQAMQRIDSQMPLSEKEERAARTISSARPLAEVRRELQHLYKELTRRL